MGFTVTSDDQASGSEPGSQELGAMGIPLSQNSANTDSPNLGPIILKQVANSKLQALGVPALSESTLRTQGGKSAAVKRKVEEASTIVRKKVSVALGLNEQC